MQNRTRFAEGRPRDILCLGRFGVDFYAQQIGARLEDVTSFAKYLGGSSANTAFGCARLGLNAGLISRIGDDAMGRFLVETIAREGCDVSHVGVDPSRLTAAVVLGIKDKDTFPLIFLRENCADMAIADEDIEESYIAQSRAAERGVGRRAAQVLGEAGDILEPGADLLRVEVDSEAAEADDVEPAIGGERRGVSHRDGAARGAEKRSAIVAYPWWQFKFHRDAFLAYRFIWPARRDATRERNDPAPVELVRLRGTLLTPRAQRRERMSSCR